MIQLANFIFHLRRQRRCIKRTIKDRSPTVSHSSRTYRVVLDRHYDRINLGPMIQTECVNTTLAIDRHFYNRIIHRRQMDTTDTDCWTS